MELGRRELLYSSKRPRHRPSDRVTTLALVRLSDPGLGLGFANACLRVGLFSAFAVLGGWEHTNAALVVPGAILSRKVATAKLGSGRA